MFYYRIDDGPNAGPLDEPTMNAVIRMLNSIDIVPEVWYIPPFRTGRWMLDESGEQAFWFQGTSNDDVHWVLASAWSTPSI